MRAVLRALSNNLYRYFPATRNTEAGVGSNAMIGKSAYFAGVAFGGSSLMIVVGVALETVRELESQMTLRNYKGFLD